MRWIVNQPALSETEKRRAVREFCDVFFVVQRHSEDLRVAAAWLRKMDITETFAETRLKTLNAQEKSLITNIDLVAKSLQKLFDLYTVMNECKGRIDGLISHPKCANNCRIHCNSSKPKKTYTMPRGRPNVVKKNDKREGKKKEKKSI